VVGEQLEPADSLACLQIAGHLGWPLAADALSGFTHSPDTEPPHIKTRLSAQGFGGPTSQAFGF